MAADQNEVELIDWPLCGADLNPIENVWADTKRVMAENWPDPSQASKGASRPRRTMFANKID
jgi:transposase